MIFLHKFDLKNLCNINQNGRKSNLNTKCRIK